MASRSTLNVGQVQGMLQVKEVAEAVQSELAQVGIKLNVVELETAAMFDGYAASEFEMYFFPWRSNPEAARHFNTLLHSQTRGYYYANPEMDVLIDDFMTEMDPAARYEKGKVLNAFVQEEVPLDLHVCASKKPLASTADRINWNINQAAVDMFFGTELSPAK